MEKLILLKVFIGLSLICYSQTPKDTCNVMLRVINNTKYNIDNITINDSINIGSLSPKNTSEFECINIIYTLFKYDVTFTKKRLIGNLKIRHISQPVDYVGEERITQRVVELFLTIEKKKHRYKIKFETNKL